MTLLLAIVVRIEVKIILTFGLKSDNVIIIKPKSWDILSEAPWQAHRLQPQPEIAPGRQCLRGRGVAIVLSQNFPHLIEAFMSLGIKIAKL